MTVNYGLGDIGKEQYPSICSAARNIVNQDGTIPFLVPVSKIHKVRIVSYRYRFIFSVPHSLNPMFTKAIKK
jgi:hypothetical protein